MSSTAAVATTVSSVAITPVSASPRVADEFVDYDAIGMADLIKSGEITAREAVEITIRRIEAMEPIINVINTRTYERAYDRAETIAKDTTFAGVPILIKDMIDVGGVRRSDGSRMMLTNIPQENVKYIDGVEEAGMNIVGMTNVPEFAQLGVITNNTAFGLSRNPWNLSLSTLGSSGGSGAAVAAGIVPMAHGTDGGGSNRLPSCAQGVFGMKPSRARMLPGEAGGVHGPVKTNQALSRTVRDSAALFARTEDPDGPFKTVGLISGPSTRRLRIGFAPAIRGGLAVEPPVAAAQESTAQLLRDLGHEVVGAEIPVNHDEFFAHYNGAFLGQFGVFDDQALAISGSRAADSGLLDPFTASLIAYGAETPDDVAAAGLEYLATVPSAYAKLFSEIDVLLSPVMPFLSVAADALTPQTLVNDSVLEFLQHGLSYTASANVSGHCAMSVPLNWDPVSGLPIGSMFQSATGNDGLLYQLAFELEESRPWKDRWAPYSVKHIPI
jgi:amidase